ncbi:hypothetical protein [Haliscomenobacter hydrossis]|uniref:hypothetical protein n=1 Tax=Haliscomenobacter hydrossis TaxID=2350 RepID=UPI0011D296D2|nr:hypothetical protein [Haliscomenobacter hydrossis]
MYNTNVGTGSSTLLLRYEYAIRDHLDAIVVINSENIDEFNRTRGNQGTVGEEKIRQLRDLGDNYMVQGMLDLLKMSTSRVLKHNYYYANDESKQPLLHPELSASFNVESDGKNFPRRFELNVDFSGDILEGDAQAVGLDYGGRPQIHTHPAEGWSKGLIFVSYKDSKLGGPKLRSTSSLNHEVPGPSDDDYENSMSRGNRLFDVIIDPENIYLYRGARGSGKFNKDAVSKPIPISFFKK